MTIERNHPVTFYDIDVCPRTSDDNRVVLVRQLDDLLKALTIECSNWEKDDGKIYWDSPEAWLRKQLGI